MGRSFKFVGVEDVLEAVRDAEPTHEYVTPMGTDDYRPSDIHQGRRVTWIGSKGYLVWIPVENVEFTPENQWNFGHAAALLEGIQDETSYKLEVPAGRVYRVKAKDVKESQKYEDDGELEDQLAMVSPWERHNVGEYHVRLLDGNHRAAAAILAGESQICVYVSENFRENVYKKDFV